MAWPSNGPFTMQCLSSCYIAVHADLPYKSDSTKHSLNTVHAGSQRRYRLECLDSNFTCPFLSIPIPVSSSSSSSSPSSASEPGAFSLSGMITLLRYVIYSLSVLTVFFLHRRNHGQRAFGMPTSSAIRLRPCGLKTSSSGQLATEGVVSNKQKIGIRIVGVEAVCNFSL